MYLLGGPDHVMQFSVLFFLTQFDKCYFYHLLKIIHQKRDRSEKTEVRCWEKYLSTTYKRWWKSLSESQQNTQHGVLSNFAGLEHVAGKFMRNGIKVYWQVLYWFQHAATSLDFQSIVILDPWTVYFRLWLIGGYRTVLWWQETYSWRIATRKLLLFILQHCYKHTGFRWLSWFC